eukprot:evm.model.NODE_1036_length_14192_cov_28.241686.5
MGTALRSLSPAFRAAATRSPSSIFRGGEEEDEEMEVGLHFLAPAVVADSLLLTSEEEVVAELEELENNSWGGVQDEADEQTIKSRGSGGSSWGGMEDELSSLIVENSAADAILALPGQQREHSASDMAIRPDPIRLPVLVGEAFPLVDIDEGVEELKKEGEWIDGAEHYESTGLENTTLVALLPVSGSATIPREEEGIDEDEDENEEELVEDDGGSESLEGGEEDSTLGSHSFKDAHEVGSHGSQDGRDGGMSALESLHGFETAEEGDLITI